jgi:hypothetical protein
LSFEAKTKVIENNLNDREELPSEVISERSKGRNQAHKLSSFGKPKAKGVN